MPWLRPMQGVNLYLRACLAMEARQDLHILKQDVRRLHHLDRKRVSPTSLLVRPKWNQRLAWLLIFSATAVVEGDDIMIERFLPIPFCRATRPGKSANHFPAPAFILAKSALGTMPSATSASAARSSICSQRRSLFFVRPDGPHFRSGIARNHASSVKRRVAGV